MVIEASFLPRLALKFIAFLMFWSILSVVVTPGKMPMVLYSMIAWLTAVMMYAAALSVILFALILLQIYSLLTVIIFSVWLVLLSPDSQTPRYLAGLSSGLIWIACGPNARLPWLCGCFETLMTSHLDTLIWMSTLL